MGEYHASVRLSDKGADVSLGQMNFIVSRRDDVGTARGCPIEYLAAALGS